MGRKRDSLAKPQKRSKKLKHQADPTPFGFTKEGMFILMHDMLCYFYFGFIKIYFQ